MHASVMVLWNFAAIIIALCFEQELYSILGKKGEGGRALEELIHAFIVKCGSTVLMQQILPLLTDVELLSCLRHVISRSDAGAWPTLIFLLGTWQLKHAFNLMLNEGKACYSVWVHGCHGAHRCARWLSV
jgi:hypothetical protein